MTLMPLSVKSQTSIQHPRAMALVQQVPTHQLIQAMPNGVVLLDSRGIVTEANPEAKRLLGSVLVGQLWRKVIRQSFRPQADDGHEVSLVSGRRVKLDISSLSPSPGQLIVLTDLSETRALQSRVSHLQRLTAMGKMVASLAHQIRTPLSAAILYAENLDNPNTTAEQIQNFSQKIQSNLSTLEAQVNDMLMYAKSGEQQTLQQLSLVSFCQELEEQLDILAQRKEVTIQYQLPSETIEFLGNQTALLGALKNILMNAIEASPAGGVVYVDVQRHKESLKWVIEDQGAGIPQETLKQIFMPFFTQKTNGTGLGLAVAKTVIRAHQGHIQVDSQAGQGSRFIISLPLLKNKQGIKAKIRSPKEKKQYAS